MNGLSDDIEGPTSRLTAQIRKGPALSLNLVRLKPVDLLPASPRFMIVTDVGPKTAERS